MGPDDEEGGLSGDLDICELANSALVLLDIRSDWLECYPKAARSEEHIIETMQDFAKPTDDVRQFYCDNGGELESASRNMTCRRPTSTPEYRKPMA